MSGIFVVGAKRTSFGNFCGSLKEANATILGTISAQAVLESCKEFIKSTDIDNVAYGNVLQTSDNAPYLARHIALQAGVKEDVPAVTLNRLCGSGFEAISYACMSMMIGRSNIALVGGAENMSQAPFILRGLRSGIKLSFGKGKVLEDSLATCLFDQQAGMSMGETAERIASQYKISRSECDKFAMRSHSLSHKGFSNGSFADEIFATPYVASGKNCILEQDEGIRAETTIEKLGQLKPVFSAAGVVTAANASGITDGAASLLLCTKKAIEETGITPIAEIVDWHVIGVDPKMMGMGPVEAIRGLLARTKLNLKDLGHIEINEAFAPQVLGVCKELGLENDLGDDGRVNPRGGAIALGHPLAASGARIVGHLAHSLAKSEFKYALGSACIGGGQGFAMLLRKCNK